jgi:hypothetical protein
LNEHGKYRSWTSMENIVWDSETEYRFANIFLKCIFKSDKSLPWLFLNQQSNSISLGNRC